MTDSATELSEKVIDALKRGKTIEAIKLLRASSGLGLAEAKHLLEEYVRSKSSPASPAATSASPVVAPPSVTDALRRGNKIEAIKLMREHTGLGMKDAKDAVDALEATVSGTLSTLSPGEVPRSGGKFMWVIILVAIAVAGYFLLGNAD